MRAHDETECGFRYLDVDTWPHSRPFTRAPGRRARYDDVDHAPRRSQLTTRANGPGRLGSTSSRNGNRPARRACITQSEWAWRRREASPRGARACARSARGDGARTAGSGRCWACDSPPGARRTSERRGTRLARRPATGPKRSSAAASAAVQATVREDLVPLQAAGWDAGKSVDHANGMSGMTRPESTARLPTTSSVQRGSSSRPASRPWPDTTSPLCATKATDGAGAGREHRCSARVHGVDDLVVVEAL